MFETARTSQLKTFSQYLREATGKGYEPIIGTLEHDSKVRAIKRRCALGCVLPNTFNPVEGFGFIAKTLSFDYGSPEWGEFRSNVICLFDSGDHTFESLADLIDAEIKFREEQEES